MAGQLDFSGGLLGRPERKRTPVRKSDRKFLRKVQGGRCARCGKSFSSMGVRPILHHKNLNPKDNRPINMILICPNCHDKIHQKERKVVRIVRTPFGMTERKVVRIGKKRRTTKKRRKRKTNKRTREYLDMKIKTPRFKFKGFGKL